MSSNKVKATEVIGDDIILSVDTENLGEAKQLYEAVSKLWPDKKFIVVKKGFIEQISEAEMNGLGWYRKADHE